MTSLIHAPHGRMWPGILDVRRLLHSWGAEGRDQAKQQGGAYLKISVRGSPSLLGELTIRTLYGSQSSPSVFTAPPHEWKEVSISRRRVGSGSGACRDALCGRLGNSCSPLAHLFPRRRIRCRARAVQLGGSAQKRSPYVRISSRLDHRRLSRTVTCLLGHVVSSVDDDIAI